MKFFALVIAAFTMLSAVHARPDSPTLPAKFKGTTEGAEKRSVQIREALDTAAQLLQ
jgi:hypothetical protein